MLSVIASVLARRLSGEPPQAYEKRAVAPPAPTPGVMVLPMHGVLAPRMNLLSDISGGTTFEEATRDVRQAVANPNVTAIVLDLDSPGGSCAGAPEFAREVLKARSVKPVISQANFAMCSAAYWIGACATEIVAAPSASVGSIGVYTIHEDLSKAFELLGIKHTYICAGKYKVDGNEAEPLSDSARARLTSLVEAKYTAFVRDVARGRGIPEAAVRGGYGEGRTLTAEEALAEGMIDRIGTLDETLDRLTGTPATARGLTAVDTPPELDAAAGQDRRRMQATYEAALWGLVL